MSEGCVLDSPTLRTLISEGNVSILNEKSSLDSRENAVFEQQSFKLENFTFPYTVLLGLVSNEDKVKLSFDYRSLADTTRKRKYRLPPIEDVFDHIGSLTIFTKLKLAKVVRQISLEKSGTDGSSELDSNTTEIFMVARSLQSIMSRILQPVIDKYVILYLDEVLIYSRNFVFHESEVRNVFEIFMKNNIKVYGEQCVFATKEIDFLGYTISLEGIRPSKESIDTIIKRGTPMTELDSLLFLDLTDYYRKCIPQYDVLVAPIERHGKGNETWGLVHDAVFEKLKEVFKSSPVLISPKEEDLIVVTVGVYNETTVGATIEQRDRLELNFKGVVACFGKNFLSTEMNYAVREKDFLSIIEVLKRYRLLLLGKHFILRANYLWFEYMLSLKHEPNYRIDKWLDYISEYDFEVEYIPGHKIDKADVLIRKDICDDAELPTTEVPLQTEEFFDNVRKAYKLDSYFNGIIELLYVFSKGYKKFESLRNYIFEDGLLYFITSSQNDGYVKRLCIPYKVKKHVFDVCHKSKTCGHFGDFKTAAVISLSYYWPNMRRDVRRYIKKCHCCKKVREQAIFSFSGI